MGDEASEEHQRSLAAPFIFFVVLAFQFASHWIDHFKKSGSDKEKETKLRGEIKELLKEASSLSQPSTFAQAAKLKRLAAAKERELAKCQNLHHKDDALYSKVLLISKRLFAMRRYGGGILYAALPLHMQRGCFRIRSHDQQVTKAQLYRCTRA
uniref:Uncharacterized protein n=1 Tax=Glycine max TaxID=3847 RepID=C6T812_SOYBN|nr:unknown [Glycine max]